MNRFTILDIPSGSLILAASEVGPSSIHLTQRRGQAAMSLARKRLPEAEHDPKLLPDLQADLKTYFAGKPVQFDPPAELNGLTPFQTSVLKACAKIPFGQTVTYGELARRVGRPKAARAVGMAMARNPLPIVIPCHRVTGSGGGLGGFSAEQGIEMKKWLLEMEARSVHRQ